MEEVDFGYFQNPVSKSLTEKPDLKTNCISPLSGRGAGVRSRSRNVIYEKVFPQSIFLCHCISLPKVGRVAAGRERPRSPRQCGGAEKLILKTAIPQKKSCERNSPCARMHLPVVAQGIRDGRQRLPHPLITGSSQ